VSNPPAPLPPPAWNSRACRPKHRDDHVRARGIAIEWHVRDPAGKNRDRRLLHDDAWTGPFGCGAAQTAAACEAYAGLNCHVTADEATLRGDEPSIRASAAAHVPL
jgi:hypothetical protein